MFHPREEDIPTQTTSAYVNRGTSHFTIIAQHSLLLHNPFYAALKADGEMRYFKHRMDERFDREVDMLGRIRQAGIQAEEGARVAQMSELVVSGDKVVGLLVKMIEGGYTLTSEKAWEEPDLARKWEGQVRCTVGVLHGHDIVWGDVNPGNVVIDGAGDAWVIDFGEMNAPRFVDDALAETKEGDLQGLERLFGDWLPNRRRDTHQEDSML